MTALALYPILEGFGMEAFIEIMLSCSSASILRVTVEAAISSRFAKQALLRRCAASAFVHYFDVSLINHFSNYI